MKIGNSLMFQTMMPSFLPHHSTTNNTMNLHNIKAKTPIVLAVMLLALWKASAEDVFDKPGIVKIAIETQAASKAIPDRSPGTWLVAKVLEGDKVFTGATIYYRGHGTEGKLDKSPNLTIKFDSTDPAKQFHGHQTILLDNAVLEGQRRFGSAGSDRELGQIFSAKYFCASLQQNDGSFPRIAGTLRCGFL